MPTINLDEAKVKLAGLKTRAEGLTAKKEGLQKDLTIQEQNRERALQELSDLGYPQVKGMNAKELQEFSDKLSEEFQTSLSELETVVVSTEKLMGVSTGASELD